MSFAAANVGEPAFGFCPGLPQTLDIASLRYLDSMTPVAKSTEVFREEKHLGSPNPEAALLTGCQDSSYAFGLATALSVRGVHVDIIGNDRVDCPEFHGNPNLTFFNLGGIQRPEASFSTKLFQVLLYYMRLIRYLTLGKPKLIHILWNSKFEYFDRTLLMLYCRLLGKRVALTAHNVNRAKRDQNDSLLNRLTLKIQYHLADQIFVHTDKMRTELLDDFGIRGEVVSKIPFGVNIAVPRTSLSPAEAKNLLGIRDSERTILFFGRIALYKGLEYLLTAFQGVLSRRNDYKLIIAGEPMKGYEEYMSGIQSTLNDPGIRDRIIRKLEFIRDEDTEIYFKAADVLVLPYKDIFQSGVLFLGFSFGLPAVTADVGSFREDIVEGRTGFMYDPGDPASLAATIEKFFSSDLYSNLDTRRSEIREYATANHSWRAVGEITQNAYEKLIMENAK